MTPYHKYVSESARLLDDAKRHPLGDYPTPNRPKPVPGAPKVLFFAPHPDDECISGGMAVRLLREAGMNVINVAVTQGSNRERQAGRYQELQAACNYVGFGLQATGPSGLERINPKTRESDPAHWKKCVDVILAILKEHQPKIVMFPHDRDWNSTHIGTNLLVIDALKGMPAEYQCFTVETEFWGAMDDPNVMVELSSENVGDMITALSFHVGEVNRNPYHLLLPPWMMDNVRRGGEVVGGQGGAAPDFKFAVLNRLRRWQNGQLSRFYTGGRLVSISDNIGTLFA
jgi:LmbE family N-acetylglucosaminyl deacetylase